MHQYIVLELFSLKLFSIHCNQICDAYMNQQSCKIMLYCNVAAIHAANVWVCDVVWTIGKHANVRCAIHVWSDIQSASISLWHLRARCDKHTLHIQYYILYCNIYIHIHEVNLVHNISYSAQIVRRALNLIDLRIPSQFIQNMIS